LNRKRERKVKEITPKFYILATPENTGEMLRFLDENEIAWRPEHGISFTEALMEFAGRLCYDSWENCDGSFTNKNLTKVRTGNKNYLGNLIKQGHLSVFEHCGPLTILFTNVSRVFTHELVRHRAGCSYSQTSGRYVRPGELSFMLPPGIPQQALDIMKQAVEFSENAQKELETLFDWDAMSFHEKKQLTSAFRRILPEGRANNIILSCNHRAMRNIIEQRTSDAAEVEIRTIFRDLALKLNEHFPNIYQDMIQIDTGEIKFGY